ncbi:MAG: hypothetical protein F6J93_01585 [Oscillatoria sp. SIO1A7]|nr:hypothetical protein [Oscillatoria sp. SIO1A7]
MAIITIEDISPELVERLEVLADRHGRSLQEELKQILELAAPTSSLDDNAIEIARKKAALIRQQIAAKWEASNIEQKPVESKLDAAAAIAGFRAFRQKISNNEMSIREMREEGRRF